MLIATGDAGETGTLYFVRCFMLSYISNQYLRPINWRIPSCNSPNIGADMHNDVIISDLRPGAQVSSEWHLACDLSLPSARAQKLETFSFIGLHLVNSCTIFNLSSPLSSTHQALTSMRHLVFITSRLNHECKLLSKYRGYRDQHDCTKSEQFALKTSPMT